ncbi:MAG: hypothetical protein U1E51_12600 [Candidatus Binatia bacterium]|nr:hypothetical protein [Candidatus Binatia bacterium]
MLSLFDGRTFVRADRAVLEAAAKGFNHNAVFRARDYGWTWVYVKEIK